jgi:hypothetical protein
MKINITLFLQNVHEFFLQATEYTECQAFYLVVRIRYLHPVTPKRVLLPPIVFKGGDTIVGGGGTQFRRWDRHSVTPGMLCRFSAKHWRKFGNQYHGFEVFVVLI